MNKYPERLLTEREAAEMLAVSPTTLATWRSRRRYHLPFVRLGGARAIRYFESDVLAFAASGRVENNETGKTKRPGGTEAESEVKSETV